jgi:steroid delta-isomerase-like uncharacterized protein
LQQVLRDEILEAAAPFLVITKEEILMSVEENKALVRRAVEAVNTGNLAVADEIIATDFVLHDTALPMEVRGIEGVKQWINMAHTAFPDVRVTILDLVGEGDKVAKHWTYSGTFKGEFAGIPPTGKQFKLELALSIYRFTGGKISEIWMAYNALLMMQQLGVIPTPE